MSNVNPPLKTKAEILKDSVNIQGDRITTFKLTYHRFILPELNTHRVFSRNSASSRAIPIQSQIDYVNDNLAFPVHWGQNQKGMQAKNKEVDSPELAKYIWNEAKNKSIKSVNELININLHKQTANRLLEPFVYIQTILTATEFNNFFNLRYHKDAQPEIKLLAELMYEEYNNSVPDKLDFDQWHLPYVDLIDNQYYVNGNLVSKIDAIKISMSCIAQISYRKLDFSLEKAEDLYNKFVSSYPIHASPSEHLATPFSYREYYLRLKLLNEFKANIDTDIDRNNEIDFEHFLYKRNFKGWTQFRVGILNETKLTPV